MHYLSKPKMSEIYGKTCLLRADLNIENGMEKDAFRLQTIIPTIKFLLKNKCKIIIISHRGQPAQNTEHTCLRRHGIQNTGNKNLSLKPFAQIIAQKIKKPVTFLPYINPMRYDLIGLTSDVLLLENLRFWEGEEKNDPKFAKQLASLADFYVNDAFSVCHRKHASIVAITKFLPSYAGLRLEEEIKNLDAAIKTPKHPLTVIIGGAKITDKLSVVKNFLNKADYFLFGGEPANTLLAVYTKSANFKRYDLLKLVKNNKIKLPIDLQKNSNKILDIGPKTIKEYSKIIQKSNTIIWNGPMGLFENKKFANGTIAIWKAIISRIQNTEYRIQVVVGGGETIESLKLITNYQLLITKNRNLFLSTGGAAMLQYLSGKTLPGIKILNR